MVLTRYRRMHSSAICCKRQFLYWVADLLKCSLYVVSSEIESRDKQRVDGVLGKVDEAVRGGVVYGKVDAMVGFGGTERTIPRDDSLHQRMVAAQTGRVPIPFFTHR